MDSDAEENVNWKEKAKFKACKKFSIALIRQAGATSWEEHEIASLVLLVAKELELDNLKTLKLLQKCNVCTPVVIQCLVDNDITFSPSQIINAILDQTDDTDSFIKAIGVCFEQELLDGTDDETLIAVSITGYYTLLLKLSLSFLSCTVSNSLFVQYLQLFDVADNFMNAQQFNRFTHVICDHSKTKRSCGKVLNIFTGRMTESEAVSFICDIVEFDFFMDLSGSMKGFYKNLIEVGEGVELMLKATKSMDDKGNIVDSDADDEGNLR